MRHHKSLTLERWVRYSLDKQILMVGSEFARAKVFLRSGEVGDAKECFERAFELLDLCADDPQWSRKRKELCRFREILGELYLSTKPDLSQCVEMYRVLLRWDPRTEKVEV
ncbi:MAG TPA: hypothetical protein VMG09_09850 [Bacteroidota bacterium]|nr:hypothetical protein [Bacteroidota bacterium]